MSTEKKLILGLGSNLGDKLFNIELAIKYLEEIFGSVIKRSSIYETEPWGFYADSSFLNCCVVFESNYPAIDVLDLTQGVEKRIGRSEKTLNNEYQSRIIDIDLLYYGNEIINSDRLTIPHPLIFERDFVLGPLIEICADFLDPVRKTPVGLVKRT